MAKDLTGKRFGRLVVIGRGEDYISPKGKRSIRWLCQCDCGGTALCQTGALEYGTARSCGCSRKKNHRPIIDIRGQRFGRLVAEEFVRVDPKRGVIWKCKCDCGNEIECPTKSLRSGHTKSCGCLKREEASNRKKKHGGTHTRLYNVWNGMRQRCNDPNHKSYKDYGGRGIKVCEEWDDYENFRSWALENGYDANAKFGDCTLDRIDVYGDYCPKNCRWVDQKTQAQNKRPRAKNIAV